MKSFGDWLAEIELDRYAAVFSENRIDFDVVATLTEPDLRELGLALGDRKRLIQAVAQLNRQAAEPLPVPTATAQQLSTAETVATGERRQLTVMFCDLVGSTALSEKLDPEELRGLLHEYRTCCGEVITRYDGFVARYVGDGILTYFGWPKAHEEDAERALRAALEIVQGVKGASSAEPLSVRIGIATGPVVVGEQAGVGDQSKLAVGSTPNLAARLQGLAAADQIIIAASTRRLVGNAFELADLGEHELKGIAEPVHAWRVIAVSEAASRFEASHGAQVTPLVGREQEIGLLLDRWQQAQEGEGQVVLLSGEPGIGKSRILNTLRERLEAQGAQALRFQCSPYYVNSALYPTIDNFERALKFGRDETPESKLDKLEALVAGQYGRLLSDVRLIASMLSIPCEVRYGTISITPQKRKEEILRVLVDIVEAAARKQPTVMLYEDLHWADPTTLETLDLVIDRVRTIPLLIVLTQRPEFQPKWGGHGHISALNLSKLTRTQSSAIVSKLIGGRTLPADLLEQILSKTDGVPLYVEELTKAILESGELKDAGDHYDYAGAAHTITIPATLRDSLMARLDRFAPVKEIAQIGAAIGREFSYELIAAVAPHSKTDLDSALNQLTESGLAFRRGTPPEATYTFKHALVQDTAYDSLLKTRRQALHAKIARVIEERFPATPDAEPEVLAHHCMQAGLAEQASAYWLSAGRASFGRSALTEAVRQLRFGIDQIKSLSAGEARDRRELDIQLCLGNTLIQAKGLASPEADVAFKRAYELRGVLDRVTELAPILWGIFVVRLIGGQPRVAVEIAQELLSNTQGAREGELVARTSLMDAHFWLGNFEIAQDHFDQAMALYDDDSDVKLVALYAFDMKIANLIYASHFQWMLGYPDRALRTKGMVDAWAKRLDNPFMYAFTYTWGAAVFHYRRDLDEHRLQIEKGLQVSHQIGFPHFEGQAELWCAWNRAMRGDRGDENLALFERSITHFAGTGSGICVPYFRALRAQALSDHGNISQSLALLQEVLELVDALGEASHAAEIHRIRAEVLLCEGSANTNLSEQAFQNSLDIARRQRAKSWELRTSTSLARLWQSQGKQKDAYDLLAPIYDWFTEGFDTKDLIEAKALIEELAR